MDAGRGMDWCWTVQQRHVPMMGLIACSVPCSRRSHTTHRAYAFSCELTICGTIFVEADSDSGEWPAFSTATFCSCQPQWWSFQRPVLDCPSIG